MVEYSRYLMGIATALSFLFLTACHRHQANEPKRAEHLDKPATSTMSERLELFRLVRLTESGDEGVTYLLLPMTSRVMPADVARTTGIKAVGMEDLVAGVAELPAGCRLYVADMHEFDDPRGELSRLSPTEVQQLKGLLNANVPHVVLVDGRS